MYPLAGKPLSTPRPPLVTTMYLAVLPGYIGYGLSALAATREAAEKAVRKAYLEARDQAHPDFQNMSWTKAKEYFDFHVNEVEVGKAYFADEPGEVL